MIKTTLKLIGDTIIIALFMLPIAYGIVWCLDKEEQQAREGKKDPRTLVLPLTSKTHDR